MISAGLTQPTETVVPVDAASSSFPTPTPNEIASLQVAVICHQVIQGMFPISDGRIQLPHPSVSRIALPTGQVTRAFEVDVVEPLVSHIMLAANGNTSCLGVVVSGDGKAYFVWDCTIALALDSLHAIHSAPFTSSEVSLNVRASAFLRRQVGHGPCDDLHNAHVSDGTFKKWLTALIRQVILRLETGPLQVGTLRFHVGARTRRIGKRKVVLALPVAQTSSLVEVSDRASLAGIVHAARIACHHSPFIEDKRQHGPTDDLALLFDLASGAISPGTLSQRLAVTTHSNASPAYRSEVSASRCSSLSPSLADRWQEHKRPRGHSLSPLILSQPVSSAQLAEMIFKHIEGSDSAQSSMSPTAAQSIIANASLAGLCTGDALVGTLRLSERSGSDTAETILSDSLHGTPEIAVYRHGVLISPRLPVSTDLPSTIILPPPISLPSSLTLFLPRLVPMPPGPGLLPSASHPQKGLSLTEQYHDYVESISPPGLDLFRHK